MWSVGCVRKGRGGRGEGGGERRGAELEKTVGHWLFADQLAKMTQQMPFIMN